MSEILENIKKLREITGVGFLDCKKALQENDHRIDLSIDFLRKKGLAKASKKSSRVANEGAVCVFKNENKAVLLEVNTETDFAAKNDVFLNFLEKVTNFILNNENINQNTTINEIFSFSLENKKLSEHFSDLISQIGENIVLRKVKIVIINEENAIFTYTHNSYRKNIGKICSLILAKVSSKNEEIERFGKNICMHIAASKPISIDIESLDNKLVEKEKEILKDTIKSSGKSEIIVNKIIEGKMKKFYSEVTLLNQFFILDNEKNIKDTISEFSLKHPFHLLDYSLFVLGAE